MIISKKIKMDLMNAGIPPRVDAVQNDTNSREISITLYNNGNVWSIPDGTEALISYRKPDGTGGLYNALPDGSPAYNFGINTDGTISAVDVILAPQALSVEGIVHVAVLLRNNNGDQLGTFNIEVVVHPNPSANALESEDYINVMNWMVEEVERIVNEKIESGELKGDSYTVDDVLQTTGNDATKVMSQKAVTDELSIRSNALKGKTSGEAIAISDVSPLEHKMIVSVRGVLDLSIVKVKKLGKNILPYPYTRMIPFTTNGITFTPNDDRSITISGVATGNAYFQLWNAVLGGSFAGVSTGGTNGNYAFSPYVNYSKSNNNVSLYVANGTDLSTPVTIYPQIEKGKAVTDYKPYIEPVEYPVNADGTVEGVTLYEGGTTLITDTAGAVIDCTYNRDINKAFEELYRAIISLGGNV